MAKGDGQDRRGDKGEGCIQELKPGVWRVRVDFGVDPITKRRVVVSRNVHGTENKAKSVRKQILRDKEKGLNALAAKETFAGFASTWHDARVAAGEITRTRLEREKQIIKLLSSYIGSTKLKDIMPQTIDTLYSKIRKDKGSSGTTMHMYHVLLKQILSKAVDYDMILKNPCDRVDAPKSEAPERRSLTLEESFRLLENLDEAEEVAFKTLGEKEARQTEWGNLFGRSSLRGLNVLGYIMGTRIALNTGMRRGEVFGLCWGEVDLQNKKIEVKQALTSYGEIKPPKSKAGIRTVSIDADTLEHLAIWKERQKIELLKLGIKQGDKTPVSCGCTGGFVELHNFARWWSVFRKDIGFPDLKFHELRHTQATQLLANGVDVKTVQTRLGHSSAALTLDCYSHAIPKNDEAAAELIGELFRRKPKEAQILSVKTA